MLERVMRTHFKKTNKKNKTLGELIESMAFPITDVYIFY